MEVHERPLYYDLDGNPTDRDTWSKVRESSNWRLARDDVNGWMVSTVWMGLDHNLGDGPPHIYETMVFPLAPSGEVESYLEQYCERYPTAEAARAGHEGVIQWVKDNLEERG